jgi:tetratricopeptide (TPR) repeat protein
VNARPDPGSTDSTAQRLVAAERRASRLETDGAVDEAELASAYVQKGGALSLAGRAQEALSCYGEVVRRFGPVDSLDVRVSVGWALINSALELRELGEAEAAAGALKTLEGRLDGRRDDRLRVQAIDARVIAAQMLVDEDRASEALVQLSEVVAGIGESPSPSISPSLAHAIAAQVRALTELGRYSEALTVCANMLGRFRLSESEEIRDAVGQVLLNRGQCLSAVGMDVAAVAAYTELLDRFTGMDAPYFRRTSAAALLERARSRNFLGDGEAALADLDLYVAEYWEVVRPTSRIRAMSIKAGVYIDLGRFEDALPIVEHILSSGETIHDASMRDVLAGVIYNRGVIFENQGRTSDARAAYADIAKRFSRCDEPEVVEVMELASGRLTVLTPQSD